MAKYRLSNEAKEDLNRIHHYGAEKFGITQADNSENIFNSNISECNEYVTFAP